MSEFTQLIQVLDAKVENGEQLANEVICEMWIRGYRFLPVPPKVEVEVWESDPDRPGYLKLARTKTVGEVIDELREITGEYPEGCTEGYNVFPTLSRDLPWPTGRIVVFTVNGSSEGNYTHVEVQTGDGTSKLVLLGKTFDGRDASWAFARQLADLLEA
jgi:hypothetical protein